MKRPFYYSVFIALCCILATLPLGTHAAPDHEFSVYTYRTNDERNFQQLLDGESNFSEWRCSVLRQEESSTCEPSQDYSSLKQGIPGISFGNSDATTTLRIHRSHLGLTPSGSIKFDYRIRGKNRSGKRSKVKVRFEGHQSTESHTAWIRKPRKKVGWKKGSISLNNLSDSHKNIQFSIESPKRSNLKLQLRKVKYAPQYIGGYISVLDFTSTEAVDYQFTAQIYDIKTNTLETEFTSETTFLQLAPYEISGGNKRIDITYRGNTYSTSLQLKRTNYYNIHLLLGDIDF